MASNNVIRIPESEKAFEDRIAILFACIINDENLKGVATRGKKQEGLDLLGTRDRDPMQPVGIQCKLKTKHDKLQPSEAERDIRKALGIVPALTEMFVVTTAEDDIELDKLALSLRQEQLQLGRKVSIEIWGWTELQRRIRGYPEALRAFDPDYSPSTNLIIATTTETLATVQSGFGHIDTQFAEMMGMVRDMAASVADPEKGPAIEKLLDEQVDEYRHLLNTGKPKTALELLERMEGKLPDTASSSIRSRIRANIGFAHMRLGDEPACSASLMRAFELNPQDPKAKANRLMALIYDGRPQQAIDDARTLLVADPTNAAVASYAYQAAGLIPGCDPDEFVPGELRSDENTAVNRTNLLRSRERPEWREAARELYEAHPASGVAKRFAAEAMLEDAYEHRHAVSRLTEAQRCEKLLRGAQMLQEHWDEVRHFENAGEDGWLSVGVNLITAYLAIHDAEAAKRTIEQALAVNDKDPTLLIATAQFDVIFNRSEEAVARVNDLPESPQRTLVLAMALTDLKRWPDVIALLTPERRDAVREIDRRLVDMVLARARLANGDAGNPETEVDALVARWPGDTTTAIAAADIALERGLASASERLAKAESALDQTSPLTDRVMLAQIALRVDDYALVTRVLDGFVDEADPEGPLTWLALAFANAPLRPRSHEFFEGLPSPIIEMATFARLAAAVEFRRGSLPAAERHLKRAVKENPADLRATLMLIDALRRQDRPEEARTIIRGIDETHALGSDFERIQLAVQLREAGETARSLALGYEVASHARDNETVVYVYPNLIFFNEDLPKDVSQNTTVSVGCWFELEGIDCQGTSGLIQDSQTPEVTSFSPAQALAKAILGRAVGEEVTIAQGLGPDRHYRVKAVKHRYIWLFHDILASHATRFPDATSMGEMTMKDGDIEPIFDVIRQGDEQNKAILATYTQLMPPLTALARANNKGVLEIAELIAAQGGEILTCAGTHEERKEAELFIKKAKEKGAALDTLTVWVAHHFDLLPAMKEYFGRLAISQTTFDDLLSLRARAETNRGREYMTIGFQGEQKVREVYSPEYTEARIASFTSAIDAIKAHCEILPVDGTDDLAGADIPDRELVGGFLESIHLAQQHRLLLVCDDMHMRLVGLRYGHRRTAWLQVIAQQLLKSRLISMEIYTRTVGLLAKRRHSHVSLDGRVLVALAVADHQKEEALFDEAVHFIAGPNAEMTSHLSAVASFMNEVWGPSIPSWKAGRAIDKLLYKLVQRDPENWAGTLGELNMMLPLAGWNSVGRKDLGRLYLRGWIKGHFLRSGSAGSPKSGRAR